MPQNNLDIRPHSVISNLITFTWPSSGGVARYITQPRNWVDAANLLTYTAMPESIIDLKKQSGAAKDEPISMIMPSVAPISSMLLGYVFPEVTVVIEEIDISDLTTRRTLFKGTIDKVTGNKNGRNDQVEVSIKGLRGRFVSPLGIPANNTCAWVLGDKNCGINLAPHRVAVTLSTIVGNLVTISVGTTVNHYLRGYCEVNGLKIGIRAHTITNKILLINTPPASWLGAAATLTPGCVKSVGACGTKWSNIAQFGGFGIGIPRYHPVFETQ